MVTATATAPEPTDLVVGFEAAVDAGLPAGDPNMFEVRVNDTLAYRETWNWIEYGEGEFWPESTIEAPFGYSHNSGGGIGFTMPHTRNEVEVTFKAYGLDSGESLYLAGLAVETRLPEVYLAPPVENDLFASEGPSGTAQQAFITLKRADANYLTRPLTVSLITTGSTATAEQDYTPTLPSTVAFQPGEWNVTLAIAAIDDTQAEGSETIQVTLLDATGHDLSPEQQLVAQAITIFDNEPTVDVLAADATATESGTPATDKAVARFTRSGAGIDISQALPIHYTVLNISTSTSDYELLTGLATIPANQTSVDLDILPVDDDFGEDPESLMITVALGEGYWAGNQAAHFLIEDNDFRIVNASVGFNTQGITKDDGTATYHSFGSEWWDANGDGDADDANERKNPTSHRRSLPNSANHVIATVLFDTQGTLTGSFVIKRRHWNRESDLRGKRHRHRQYNWSGDYSATGASGYH